MQPMLQGKAKSILIF